MKNGESLAFLLFIIFIERTSSFPCWQSWFPEKYNSNEKNQMKTFFFKWRNFWEFAISKFEKIWRYSQDKNLRSDQEFKEEGSFYLEIF